MQIQYMVIDGKPSDGFSFFGPFKSEAAAKKWIRTWGCLETSGGVEIAELERPDLDA